MDFFRLLELRDTSWTLVVLALAASALITLVITRASALRELGRGLRALRERRGEGVPPGAALGLLLGGTLGAGAWVVLGDALALGGAGILPWLWLGALLAMPLAHAETWLARTEPRGRKDRDLAATGSLARHVLRAGRARALGGLLVLTTALAALLWGGLAQAALIGELAAETFGPSAALPSAAIVLALGGAAGWLLFARDGALVRIGWFGLAAVTLLGVLGLVSGLAADAGSVGAAFIDALGAALEGPTRHDAFSGATASEVRLAALVFALPLIGGLLGAQGSVLSRAEGPARRASASASFAPLTTALVVTLFALGSLGHAQFSERPTRVMLPAIRTMQMPAETASQRAEASRAFVGYVRVVEGAPRNPRLSFAHPRGMIADPHLEQLSGDPWTSGAWASGDFAYRTSRDGRVDRLMTRPRSDRPLAHAAAADWHRLSVRGDAAPAGAALIVATLGPLAPFGFALLALLSALAVAVAGLTLGRALPAARASLGRALSVLPAIAGTAALLPSPELRAFALPLGLTTLAVQALALALALALRARDVQIPR